jgi:3,4-dihydroxy 2-butanone 4-phosphate synthase/GTP cyclohydrolase II
VQAAVARDATPADLVQPGHIFPLQAQDGGVLMRAGHTEAGCDLAGMAGLTPAAVICEVMKDDGTMARLPDLQAFARRAWPEDRHHCRSHRTPQPQREPDRTHRPAPDAHAAGPLRLHQLPRQGRRPASGADRHGQWTLRDEVLVRVHEPFTALDLLDAGGAGHSWPLHAALEALQRQRAGWRCC